MVADGVYESAERYCVEYYDLGLNEVEESVVVDYVADSSDAGNSRGGNRRTSLADAIVSIEAVCAPVDARVETKPIQDTFKNNLDFTAVERFLKNSRDP